MINNDGLVLFDRSKIGGSDPHVVAVWTPYAAPPLEALPNPVVEFTGRGPGSRLHGDGWLYLAPLAPVPLAVLVEHDVHVCRPLLRFVLREVRTSPAHHSAVPDTPDAGADVASIEPHTLLEHVFGSLRRGPWWTSCQRCRGSGRTDNDHAFDSTPVGESVLIRWEPCPSVWHGC
jgi:hypothetical protein